MLPKWFSDFFMAYQTTKLEPRALLLGFELSLAFKKHIIHYWSVYLYKQT